jgi:hypothetical protein
MEVWVTASVAVLSVALATPAYADSGNGQRTPNPNAPSQTTIGTKAKPGTVSTNVLIGGAGNCYGQTDIPHASGHYYGTVNVVARTVCPSNDYVSVYLYRERWFGWEYLDDNDKWNWEKAETNAAGPCAMGDVYTYLGDSYHQASGRGDARTSYMNRFTCP